MEPYSQLTDTLTRIGVAPTGPALWSIVKDFALSRGYSHLAAVDATRLQAGHRQAMLYSDTPHVFEALDREIEPARHPFVVRFRASPRSFLVSDLRRELGIGRWSELLADTVKNGDALYVPVYKDGGPVAGFSFGGDAPDIREITRAMLSIVAHAAADRAKSLEEGKGRAADGLSLREIQCLSQVAVGYGDIEIGRILGISARTVRFHLDSAKAKLRASTRVQAVATALRERIIAL